MIPWAHKSQPPSPVDVFCTWDFYLYKTIFSSFEAINSTERVIVLIRAGQPISSNSAVPFLLVSRCYIISYVQSYVTNRPQVTLYTIGIIYHMFTRSSIIVNRP
jgi:hypothetical protein